MFERFYKNKAEMQEHTLTKYLRDGAVLDAFASYTDLRNSIQFGGMTPADKPEIMKRQRAVISALTEVGYAFTAADEQGQFDEVDDLMDQYEAAL